MKKIIFLFILFFIFTNFSFASSQSTVSLYQKKVERNEKEIDELSEYMMKYGIIYDIKYYEKLLEKHEYIVKREEAILQAFEALEDCKKSGISCIFQTYNTDTLTPITIRNLISKAEDKKNKAENDLEKLQETLDYLHKSQKEIEKREKQEEKKGKFSVEKSDAVKNESIKNTIQKTKKEEKEENIFKKKLSIKLEKLTKKYSKKEKKGIFEIILQKLKAYNQNESIKTLQEILQEKIELF